MNDLEPIFSLGMDEMQTKAYKLCLVWQELSRKELSGYYGAGRLPKSGDPRKGELFRHCYKLCCETQGLIPDEEYRYYLLAQIQVLKNIRDGEGVHARISPSALTGERAWRRWKMWRSRFKKAERQQEFSPLAEAEEEILPVSQFRINSELERSRDYLVKQNCVDKDQLRKICTDSDLPKWVLFGKVSPYFVVLSPLVREYYKERLDDVFCLDCKSLLTAIDSETTRKIFQGLFE